MGLIRFIIERYDLKEYFSSEIKIVRFILNYKFSLKNRFCRIVFFVFLFLDLFFLVYCYNYLSVLIIFCVLFLLLIKISFFFKKFMIFFANFDCKFLLLNLLSSIKMRLNFIIFKFYALYLFFYTKMLSFKFLKVFFRLFLYFIVFSDFRFLWSNNFFYSKYFSRSKIFKDTFFLKFFFNLYNPVNLSYFILLVKNLFNYYVFNRIKFYHYKLMSIPMENPTFGNIQLSWLFYAAPITFFFFLIRWNYYSELDKKFTARYYYREKMIVSYFKNFSFLFYFCLRYIISIFNFFCKKFVDLVIYVNSPSGAEKLPLLTSFVYYTKKFYYILYFNLNIVITLLIALIFVKFFAYFCSAVEIVFFNSVLIFFRLVKNPARVVELIKLFFFRVKLKIFDRVAYVPKFINFGRGVRFRRRFRYKEFYFVINIIYWTKRDFTKRFAFFKKFKKFIVRKRYAGFKIFFRAFLLAFKSYYLVYNCFTFLVDYLIMYPFFWAFRSIIWSLCSDLCFVF